MLAEREAALSRLADAAADAENAADEAQAIAALRPLFADTGWLRAIARGAADSLAAHPFHLFGLTAMTSGALQQLLLVSGPRASVTLCTLGRPDAGESARPGSHAFVGNRSLMRVLSDEPLQGRLAILSRASGTCLDRPIAVRPDHIFDMDERRRVLWIAPPARQALFLRARIRRLPAPLVRSYRPGEAAPHALANGDDGLARSLALIAVLRVLNTPPPVEALRALLPRAHGAQRWALMREMLALDTMASWPDLASMARTESDPAVHAAATRMLARLDPDMMIQREGAPCPA